MGYVTQMRGIRHKYTIGKNVQFMNPRSGREYQGYIESYDYITEYVPLNYNSRTYVPVIEVLYNIKINIPPYHIIKLIPQEYIVPLSLYQLV